MTEYVIGDVQGCYDELIELLRLIKFNAKKDRVIFVGDLVNRGPKSLEVLKYIKQLGSSAVVVLGNHDLYCIAVAYKYINQSENDTISEVLSSPDKNELMEWLCQQKFMHKSGKHVITHAGLPHIWTLEQAKELAKELESTLSDPSSRGDYLANLFGNKPNIWSSSLTGSDRLRCLTNYFTRMRICTNKGQMELSFKGHTSDIPQGYDAWFNYRNTNMDNNIIIIFGHWAALHGVTNTAKAIAIDTGCSWGHTLSAYCLDTSKTFHVNSQLQE